MELAAYLHQHLAPTGNESPVIYSDVLAEQVADTCIHWLQHDPDGLVAAWRAAHPGVYREHDGEPVTAVTVTAEWHGKRYVLHSPEAR